VNLSTAEQWNWKSTSQTVSSGIESQLLRGPLAGRGKTAEVCHRGASGERSAPRGWQSKEVEQPADDRQFGLCRGRAREPQTGVLIECGGEPIAGERRRRGAARNESEVARAWGAHDTRCGAVDPLAEGIRRRAANLRQRMVEAGTHLLWGGMATHRQIRKRGQIVDGQLVRGIQRGGPRCRFLGTGMSIV
jgi:hypothetical protein